MYRTGKEFIGRMFGVVDVGPVVVVGWETARAQIAGTRQFVVVESLTDGSRWLLPVNTIASLVEFKSEIEALAASVARCACGNKTITAPGLDKLARAQESDGHVYLSTPVGIVRRLLADDKTARSFTCLEHDIHRPMIPVEDEKTGLRLLVREDLVRSLNDIESLAVVIGGSA